MSHNIVKKEAGVQGDVPLDAVWDYNLGACLQILSNFITTPLRSAVGRWRGE